MKIYNDSDLLLNIGMGVVGGDNLTRNPNRDQIISKIKESLNNNYSNMSKREKVDKWGKSGKLNGMYGKTHTEEVRLILSEKAKGIVPPNKGIKMSKERHAVHMVGMSKRDINGNKNNFFGKQHSQETKEKLRDIGRIKMKSSMIPVSLDDVEYECVLDASKALKVSCTAIKYRIDGNTPLYANWIYL